MSKNVCNINFMIDKDGEEVPSILYLNIERNIKSLNLPLDKLKTRAFVNGVYATIKNLKGFESSKNYLTEYNNYYKDNKEAFDENGEPVLDYIINMKSTSFLDILKNIYEASTDSSQSFIDDLQETIYKDFNERFDFSQQNLQNSDELINAYNYLQKYNDSFILKGNYVVNLISDNNDIRPEVQQIQDNKENTINEILSKYNAFNNGLKDLGLNSLSNLYNTIIFNTAKYSRSANINNTVEKSFKYLIDTINTLQGNTKTSYIPNLTMAIKLVISTNSHFAVLKNTLSIDDLNMLLEPSVPYNSKEEISAKDIEKAALKLISNVYTGTFNTTDIEDRLMNSIGFLLNSITDFYKNININHLTSLYNTIEDIIQDETEKISSNEPETDEVLEHKKMLLRKVTLLLNRYLDNKNIVSHNYKNVRNQKHLIESILLKGDLNNFKDGFYQFTQEILTDLKALDASIDDMKVSTSIQRKAAVARDIQVTVKSFDSIKAMLDDYLIENPNDNLNKDIQFKRNMKEISALIETYRNTFKSIASPIFAEFLQKFGIENVKVVSNNQIVEMSVSEYLKNPLKDITFFDRWLSSMADSSNEILRIIDIPVQKTKFNIMSETNTFATKIMAMGKDFKDFKFLYEVDNSGKRTGLYVDGSNLTGKEKEFYDFFMEAKEKFDEMIPVGKDHSRVTIKILRDFTERLLQSKTTKDFGMLISRSLRDEFIQTSNDADMTLSSPHLDADGKPLEYLPLHYVYLREGETEDDVSMDAVSTLIAYANMAITYDKMNEIVNGMEVARAVITNSKLTQKYKEGFASDKYSIEQQITTDITGSNLINKINDYFASIIYGVWTKDQGSINIFGKDVSIAKSANLLNKLTSYGTIAVNIASAISNVATGTSIMLTEAASGEFFNVKDLAWAEMTLNKILPKFINNKFSRIKTDKFSLFMKYSNMMDKFEEDIRNVQFDRHKLSNKLFTSSTLFMMMDIGETWMYGRTALSLAHNTFLIDKNTKKRVNLWEALETKYIDDKDHSKGGDLYIPENKYVKEDGSDFTEDDRYKFINRLHGIDQKIHGIYNKQDRSQAERGALGRLVLLFRKWMKTAYDKRFHSKKYNYLLESEEEGYYKTFGKVIVGFIKDLKSMQFSEALNLNKDLSKTEKANMKRATMELSMFLLVVCAKMLLGGNGHNNDDDDDPLKDAPYAKRLLTYQVFRLYNELGALVPLPTMIQEGLKIANSPAAGVNTLEKFSDLFTMLVNPGNWFGLEDIKSGEFKGHSPVFRAFVRTIPGIKTIMRDIKPEGGIPYYKNNGTY